MVARNLRGLSLVRSRCLSDTQLLLRVISPSLRHKDVQWGRIKEDEASDKEGVTTKVRTADALKCQIAEKEQKQRILSARIIACLG